ATEISLAGGAKLMVSDAAASASTGKKVDNRISNKYFHRKGILFYPKNYSDDTKHHHQDYI
ncbi:MAG: hypothetical protein K0U24_05000, partial [Gammaproteobacteria bacterium]|nr:hypothetical protein [Gammaproteobacteria bacterium]